MKKYTAPELAVSLFDSESVVMVSGPVKTEAIEEAKSTFAGMADVKHVFTVNLGE